MNQKDLWTTIIVAAIVAVIASVVTASVMNVRQSPAAFGSGSSNQIRAHSCDADGTCEIREASVEGGIYAGGDIKSDKDVVAYGALKAGVVEILNGSTAGKLFVQYDAYIHDRAFIDRVLARQLSGEFLSIKEENYPGGVDIRRNSIRADYLMTAVPVIGNNTGYACIDSVGKIFRSSSPCR